ncbi:hypothetical protein UFOVP99_35 [uncultured Caudovirales phage]|uniref:Uncharacterized protein n=1 Tax=uncultured Caudovirales phage TaxID=2100421 RepID=A0A6J5L737_9CAUD|nr:hypothetical protein UFOVP99_35 [uncultured Caudovirales phage]
MAKPETPELLPADTAAPAPAPDLASLLAGLSPAHLAALAALAQQQQPNGKRRDDGGIAPLGEPQTEGLTVRLQARHLDYLTRRAAWYGEAPEMHLVRIMLEFRTSDPWDAVATVPAGMGAQAGSAPLLG